MSRVMGAALVGVDGAAIEVEVRISSQLPRVDLVGLPEAAVRESAARVRAAIAAADHSFPDRRVTINLAPAGVRKSGAGLDLAIAIGVLAASGAVPAAALEGLGLLGELALDGRVRGVRGALAQVLALRDAGCRTVIVPGVNGAEAALAPAVDVRVASHLGEVLGALVSDRPLSAAAASAQAPAPPSAPDLAHVRGQERAKRALEIAASGGHGLLLRGPPGSGKTLLARTLPGILPPLDFEEALEVTRIHSAAGCLDLESPLVAARPFRAPHHTASRAGLLGGGVPPRPGEVSLAHGGVLFLDELPEFERRSLESLRQVLEEGRVSIARAHGSHVFPARFQLVAAANPCPCGYYGSRIRDCRCDEAAVARYEARLSGPLLDRIDLHVRVGAVSFAALEAPRPEPASLRVRERVERARSRQRRRLGGSAVNARLPVGTLEELVRPTREARRVLRRAAEGLGLSARAVHRILRVARTVADLAGEEEVGAAALAEAVDLRRDEPGAPRGT